MSKEEFEAEGDDDFEENENDSEPIMLTLKDGALDVVKPEDIRKEIENAAKLEVLNELKKSIVERKDDVIKKRQTPNMDIEKGWDLGQIEAYNRILSEIERMIKKGFCFIFSCFLRFLSLFHFGCLT